MSVFGNALNSPFNQYHKSENKEVCSFWLKGNCRFGSKCKNLHQKINPKQSYSQSTTQNPFGSTFNSSAPSSTSSPFRGWSSPSQSSTSSLSASTFNNAGFTGFSSKTETEKQSPHTFSTNSSSFNQAPFSGSTSFWNPQPTETKPSESSTAAGSPFGQTTFISSPFSMGTSTTNFKNQQNSVFSTTPTPAPNPFSFPSSSQSPVSHSSTSQWSGKNSSASGQAVQSTVPNPFSTGPTPLSTPTTTSNVKFDWNAPKATGSTPAFCFNPTTNPTFDWKGSNTSSTNEQKNPFTNSNTLFPTPSSSNPTTQTANSQFSLYWNHNPKVTTSDSSLVSNGNLFTQPPPSSLPTPSTPAANNFSFPATSFPSFSPVANVTTSSLNSSSTATKPTEPEQTEKCQTLTSSPFGPPIRSLETPVVTTVLSQTSPRKAVIIPLEESKEKEKPLSVTFKNRISPKSTAKLQPRRAPGKSVGELYFGTQQVNMKRLVIDYNDIEHERLDKKTIYAPTSPYLPKGDICRPSARYGSLKEETVMSISGY